MYIDIYRQAQCSQTNVSSRSPRPAHKQSKQCMNKYASFSLTASGLTTLAMQIIKMSTNSANCKYTVE